MGMVVNPFGVVPPAPAGGDLRTVVGNAQWTAGGSGTSTSNGWLVKIAAPSGANSLLNSVWVFMNTLNAGVGMKALLVADNAGVPSSTVIAIGTATVPGALTNTVVELPFASGQTLTAGTSYWIGLVPSATIGLGLADTNFGNTQPYTVAVTYASPTWNDAADASSASMAAIWGVPQQAGAATGLHQQGSSAIFAGSGSMRLAFPPCAIGDIVRVNFGEDFGTLPTTPTGFTKTYDDQVHSFAAVRHCIYERTVDGTENGTIFFNAPSGNNRVAVATVFRGGGAKEGKTTATGSGSTTTSSAVTTAGANRRVFNFLVSGFSNPGTTNTESADTWTDVYNLGTTAGNDYTISLSYKDQASAGSAGTETRTITSNPWHVTSFAIPDV